MAGSFSSQDQAQNNQEFLDIHLHMFPVWIERTDGYWLYIEQAAAQSLESPYRQRVYHLTNEGSSAFASWVFEMNEPACFCGGWQNPDQLIPLTLDQLLPRQGCTIYLRQNPDGSFSSATRNHACFSNYRGAAYTTSEIIITATYLSSWDRGYDKEGNQMWGSTKGGYLFTKLADYPIL
jgi:hypothetical protein